MHSKIVFFVYWPITSREKKAFGIEKLLAEGIYFKVCDVTNIFNKDVIKRNPVSNAIDDEYICKLNDFRELELFIIDHAKEWIFMDYIRGLTDLDADIEKLFRYFKKHNVDYFTIVNTMLPMPEVELKPKNRWNWWKRQFKNACSPTKLYHYLLRKVIIYFRRNRMIYPLPIRIFANNAPLLNFFLKKYNLDKSVVVKLHSPDYYSYLEYEKKRSIIDKAVDSAYFVLIDEGAVGNSDYEICNIDRLNRESYIRDVNRVLGYIEEKTKLKGVIAAHPKSKYKILKDIFPEREIIEGKTLELISNADFVIAHITTAVGFAALYKKPILLLETIEMENNRHYHEAIHTRASALGIRPFRLSKDSLNNIDEYINFSVEKYEKYISTYIKTPDASEEDPWSIIISELEKYKNQKSGTRGKAG